MALLPMNADDSLLMARLGLTLLDRLGLADMPAPEAGAPPPAGRILLITSARPREGRSLIANALRNSLAAQLSGSGEVVLTDGSLLTGRLANDLPLPRASALLLFQPAAVQQALQALRDRMLLTIVDGPVLADCGALAQQADAVVVVLNARKTPRRGVEQALAAARVPPERLAGVVLNRHVQALPRWLGGT